MALKIVGMVVNKRMPAIAKVILMTLADHAHPDGTHAFPSVRLMAYESCTSKDTVRLYLTKFRKYGFIEKAVFPEEFKHQYPPQHRPDNYHFLLDETGDRLPAQWIFEKRGNSEESTSGPELGHKTDEAPESVANPEASGPDLGRNAAGQENASAYQNPPVCVPNSDGLRPKAARHKPVINQSKTCLESSPPGGAAPEAAPPEAEPKPKPESLDAKWHMLREWADSRWKPSPWDGWFEPMMCAEITKDGAGRVVYLEAPTKFIKDYFNQHFASWVEDFLGKGGTETRLQVEVTGRAYARWDRIKASRKAAS
jgi:hypothetical protein